MPRLLHLLGALAVRTARWNFAGLSGYQDTWFQCAALDLMAPSRFPLTVSPAVMMERH